MSCASSCPYNFTHQLNQQGWQAQQTLCGNAACSSCIASISDADKLHSQNVIWPVSLCARACTALPSEAINVVGLHTWGSMTACFWLVMRSQMVAVRVMEGILQASVQLLSTA